MPNETGHQKTTLWNESGEDREARLRAILETAVEGIITIDERGIIESLNPSAERIFGYPVHEVIGHSVSRLMPEPYGDEHDRYLETYLATGEKRIIGIGREIVGRRKDGSVFPMHLSVSEVQLRDRRIFTGFVRDITEQKRAAEELCRLNATLEERVQQRTRQLEEAQQQLVGREKLAMLGQLAGGVAHEIRNPLGVIKNAASYLRLAIEDDSIEIRHSFEEIERALARSNRIVSELLDYARGPRPRDGDFCLRNSIDGSLGLVPFPDAIWVELPAEGTDYSCRGDQEQIERILVNLLSNAVEAMPQGGTIRLNCYATGEAVVVEVTDTGVGISGQDLPRVFEPLFTRKATGIGLGLAISRTYAELNHGRLEVESRRGEGSTFRLTLQRADEKDENRQ